MSAMTTNTLANWFGSDRMVAEAIARELDGCVHVAIPFAGGCSIVKYLKARTLLINDLHRHVINLARVIANPALHKLLIARLAGILFHPDVLVAAQERCVHREGLSWADGDLYAAGEETGAPTDFEWAADYFVSSWMGRGGNAGTDKEFEGGISVRFNAGGGDSATRFRSATRSLEAWHKELTRDGVNFTTLDAFEFLSKCNDLPKHAIYVDAPSWIGAADIYVHKFTEADHRRLAKRLGEFRQSRVVVRYGDAPLIRELYPVERWDVREQTGRTQGNNELRELLIVNRPAVPGDGGQP
jgi:DNA adenine methylase